MRASFSFVFLSAPYNYRALAHPYNTSLRSTYGNRTRLHPLECIDPKGLHIAAVDATNCVDPTFQTQYSLDYININI